MQPPDPPRPRIRPIVIADPEPQGPTPPAAGDQGSLPQVSASNAEPLKSTTQHPIVPDRRGASGPSKQSAKAKLKKQPTGDYPEGYCRPPVRHRFDGSKAGPGRPPGAVSQDTLIKKHLNQRRVVAIEGKRSKVQARELVVMLRVKEAMAGNRHAQDYVLSQAARLFSESQAGKGQPTAPDAPDEHDRAVLDALRDALFNQTTGSPDEDAPGEDHTDTDGE